MSKRKASHLYEFVDESWDWSRGKIFCRIFRTYKAFLLYVRAGAFLTLNCQETFCYSRGLDRQTSFLRESSSAFDKSLDQEKLFGNLLSYIHIVSVVLAIIAQSMTHYYFRPIHGSSQEWDQEGQLHPLEQMGLPLASSCHHDSLCLSLISIVSFVIYPSMHFNLCLG